MRMPITLDDLVGNRCHPYAKVPAHSFFHLWRHVGVGTHRSGYLPDSHHFTSLVEPLSVTAHFIPPQG
jgi:hypothetical protein